MAASRLRIVPLRSRRKGHALHAPRYDGTCGPSRRSGSGRSARRARRFKGDDLVALPGAATALVVA